MAAQTSGDMCQDGVAVLEFDGERRARKNLLDRAEELDRGLFGGLGGGFWRVVGRRAAGPFIRGARSYDETSLVDCMPLVYRKMADATKHDSRLIEGSASSWCETERERRHIVFVVPILLVVMTLVLVAFLYWGGFVEEARNR